MDFVDWTTWQGVVAIIAGVVTTIVGFTTFFWRGIQKRNFLQNQEFQSDSHVFQLCQALSAPSPRLQMAAAALLLERLNNRESERERHAIIQALLAATIDDRTNDKQQAASSEFCKYVADSVLDVIKRSKKYGTLPSPLAKYYWQRVRIPGAYWAGADLRGIDLFGATLDGASLRRANLRKTVFYATSLKGTKLLGADLTEADLRFADMRRADLRDQEADDSGSACKTQWTGAKFEGAQFDVGTKFPPGFDPVVLGMVLAGAETERLAS